MKYLLSIFICFAFASITHAQCPNGVCYAPSYQPRVTRIVYRERQQPVYYANDGQLYQSRPEITVRQRTFSPRNRTRNLTNTWRLGSGFRSLFGRDQ